MTQSIQDFKNINRKVQSFLSCQSPYLQNKLYLKYSNKEKLPPLNELRIRIWLREIYPQFFNQQKMFNEDHELDSLQLEEIRAVFRALIEKHIKEEWFFDKMFTPELGESFALLLRNQHDRLLLDYFKRLNLDYPFGNTSNRSIWRQVFHHIAYNDQVIDGELWILYVSEKLEEDSLLLDIPTSIDSNIAHILQYYNDNPFMSVPSSTIYNTRDPITYDTLRLDFNERKYKMTTYLSKRQFPSFHILLSQSLSQQQCHGIPVLQLYPLNINSSLSKFKAAERQRFIGPILNINSLYNTHDGVLKNLISRSEVRKAMCNILYQEFINKGYNKFPDINHEKSFTQLENKCLLIALLDNTIVPSLYEGRALPLCVINDLKKFIDINTNKLINYAKKHQNNNKPFNNPVQLFIDLVESDFIIYITTGAFMNKKTWWNSFLQFIDNINCFYPVKLIRNQLYVEKICNRFSMTNNIIIDIINVIRKDSVRTDLIDEINAGKLDGQCEIDGIKGLRDLHLQLISFFKNYDKMPKQNNPHKAIKLNHYKNMTKLYEDCIILNSCHPINERNINYLNHKRFLFDANIHEKGRRYGKTIKYICDTKLNNDNDNYQMRDYVHNSDVDNDNDYVDDDDNYVDNVNDKDYHKGKS